MPPLLKLDYDVIVIGAGAAGLMCAIEAGKRGRNVCIIDHAKKPAEKIRISGGGRCNFTNLHTSAANFISQNPHFCKSALSRFTPQDFIALLDARKISWHEKKPEKGLGQLFCDNSAGDIIDMLLASCADVNAELRPQTEVRSIKSCQKADEGGYEVTTRHGTLTARSLVIASGGLSIPKMGASSFGYDIARQFGLEIIPPRPALVPLTFSDEILAHCKALSGISVEAQVSNDKASFAEGLLFTHRGLSGPSILQISSYWREGETIAIDLALGCDVARALKSGKQAQPKQQIQSALAEILPKRLADSLCEQQDIQGRLADLPDKKLEQLAARVNQWVIKPAGSEGYRTAEVTCGGVDTDALSSKTMESQKQPGLYFIGEAVDVTGHLGGFNFQWAWASGYVAGQYV